VTETPARVDVVIAVHTPARPIRRAVESVLAASDGRSAAVVVAHGTPVAGIESLLEGLPAARVRVVPFADGIRSPAGPFTHGLSLADAPFVAVMGSDDTLEPGAIDRALARASADGAEVVVLPLRHAGGELVRAPLPRWRRTRRLDPVRDRMFTRSAPLAIIRADLVAQQALVFDPSYATGEDLEFGARLWLAARASYDPADPAYVIGADAADRVTTEVAELGDVLAAPLALAGRAWVAASSSAVRRSLGVKVLRVHVLGSLLRRGEGSTDLGADEAAAVAATIDAWLSRAPGALAPFSRADRALLEAARHGLDADGLREAVAARARAGRVARLVPRNPLRVLDRESTVRRYLSYALSGGRRR
jgi:hypothetical protein